MHFWTEYKKSFITCYVWFVWQQMDAVCNNSNNKETKIRVQMTCFIFSANLFLFLVSWKYLPVSVLANMLL